EEQFYLVGIGFMTIKLPFPVNGRVQRNFSPVRKSVAHLNLVARIAEWSAFWSLHILVQIKLETIWESHFDFRLPQMLHSSASQILPFPPLLEFDLPRFQHVNSRRGKTPFRGPFRLLVFADGTIFFELLPFLLGCSFYSDLWQSNGFVGLPF